MNLEDHLGDVIRKVRLMNRVASGPAAKAAGISEAALEEMEGTGAVAPGANLAALGQAIGIVGEKLAALGAGWLPRPVDLGQWRELRCITTSAEGMSVNCYLAWDEVAREGALFDTGFDAAPILEVIDREQIQLRHVFITHSHEDHVIALPAIRERFPKVKLHSSSKHAPVDQRNRANDFIHLGSLRITNRDTPGHAEDGVTYVIGTWPEDAPHVAIVGDAIFAGSIGKGNISWDLARQKVREQIFSLPDDTLICPGHGPLTTVGEEKRHNPFF
jgi:glyoxylase-like metal-dependent hydrolase (beta-lactamase superfamily II)